jgi:hypothetical protein
VPANGAGRPRVDLATEDQAILQAQRSRDTTRSVSKGNCFLSVPLPWKTGGAAVELVDKVYHETILLLRASLVVPLNEDLYISI